MEGCGFYAHYNDGNFVLFPTFLLKVDDSKYNLISYQPIGCSYISHLDYAEKRHTSSSSAHPVTSTPTVISDDSSIAPSPLTAPTKPTLDNAKPMAPLSHKMLQKLHNDMSSFPPVPPHVTQ